MSQKLKCSHCKHFFNQTEGNIQKDTKKNLSYFKCRACVREHMRKYRLTDSSKQKWKEYKEKNRIKWRARKLVWYHLKSGNLKKPTVCTSCNKNETRIEAHHIDYNKPLEVVWLCTLCHRKSDKELL